MTAYFCGQERRLQAVKQAGSLNGIDYLEVRDTDEAVRALRQRTLYVRLLLPVPPAFSGDNVVIDGGDRIGTVEVTWAAPATALPATVPAAEQAALLVGLDEPTHVLVVRTEDRGDFSRYSLRLVAGAGTVAPPPGFDPQLRAVEFSFKVECPTDFDCAPDATCPPEPHTAPPIDYLAKDYQGFRRLMLERMALLAPGWTERNPADVGVTLVELLAYTADELSYRQDAIATEAYLGTARSRVSLRRHARLVDYRVHEGANARAWVQIDVNNPTVVLPAGTTLLSQVPELGPRLEPESRQHRQALASGPVVFETVETAVLHDDLGELHFHTWGEQHCCLPRGATSATLAGAHPQLRAGDVLVLVETASPTTLKKADADPTRRWAVRLVDVRTASDLAGGLFENPPTNAAVDVTEIVWHAEDALPFPLCVTAGDGDQETAEAWGNIVLADHGATVTGEDLGTVPHPHLDRVGVSAGGGRPGEAGSAGSDGASGVPARADPVPARYRPVLTQRPLSQVVAAPAPVAFEAALSPALRAELTALTYGPLLEALLAAHDITLPLAAGRLRGDDPLWSVGDETTVGGPGLGGPGSGSGGTGLGGPGLGGVFGTAVIRLLADGAVLRASLGVGAASAATAARPRDAVPAIRLTGELGGLSEPWVARPDLLASDGDAREFTVETEHDGTARLRFGDDEHGLRPDEDTQFTATYRIGNGVSGNVGAGALAHAVTTVSAVSAVRNPLPAAGGVDPESTEQIRRDAPQAFAVQERAVTEADYAEVAERSGMVQRAAATMRWTGSWHTVFVTADRSGGAAVDAQFEAGLRRHLERYRMAGYDLEVDGPRFVSLEVGVFVCAAPGHYRAHIARAVREALGARVLPDGRRGLFHPDHLTFGQPVHLSALYAAVHAVAGVESADVHTFQRQREPGSSGLDDGLLAMGRLEIARLDDDPNFPERGVLAVEVGGGL